MENKKNNGTNKILLFILGIALVVVAVMYYSEHRENKKFVGEITKEKASLQNELKMLSADYDSLKTSNDTLNVQMQVEQEKITELLERMKVFQNNSYAEINKYKRELGSLKKVLKSYLIQLDSLNASNKVLTEENQRVKQQIDRVKERNQELAESAEDMQKRLDRAAQLNIENLSCFPINKRGKQMKRISRTTKIKTSFTLSKNITASTGTKEIFVRIIRPDKVILSNSENRLFDFENTQLVYSAKREISYEGEALEVAVFWDNDGSLIAGEYKVDVFVEGKHVGESIFFLK